MHKLMRGKMHKRPRLLGCTGGAATSALLALGSVCAQPVGEVASQLPPVEVTGSSIQRIDAESALPLQIWRRQDIERMGATSTADFIQRLPLMQSGVPDSLAAGPGTYGFTSASLRGLGEARTLVLLNGRRLAAFGGQTISGFAAAVDLSAIPISALERVEVLSDGASSIYGADAVAGVVNFITRRNLTGGQASLGFSAPRGGAQEKRLSASKGWGDASPEGRHFSLAVSAQSREALRASNRSYAKTGAADFDHNGQRYQVVQAAGTSIPANVVNDQGEFISPYYLRNGRCPARHVPQHDASSGRTACFYDFVGDLVMLPAREQRSVLGSYTHPLGSGHRLSWDVLWSRSESKSQLAPVSGGLLVPAGSALHDQYLVPAGVSQDAMAFYRVADLGPRTGQDRADFVHLALSAQGVQAGWDYQASWAYSRSSVQTRIQGYPGALALNRLLRSGVINPFVEPGQQSAQAQQALQGSAYDGYWDGGQSTLQTLELRGSRSLAQWAHGPVMLAAGVAHQREHFESRPSLFAQGKLANPATGLLANPSQGLPGDVRFGDQAATVPYRAARQVSSVFAELSLPVAQAWELTSSGRIDHFSDFGQARTAKAGWRWQPTPTWLFRGSVGTGFRAPSVPQVDAALQPFGRTARGYDCSAELAQVAQSLGAQCRPNGSQYDRLVGGNRELKPERSRQWGLGLRFEPNRSWTLGADYWFVGLRDVINQVTEEQVFARPVQYQAAFGALREAATGANYLAFQAINQNLGKEYRSGIDLDLQTRWRNTLGQWRSTWLVSYLLRHAQQLGTDGVYYSTLGNNAELGQVNFRWQGRWVTSLQHADWQHTLSLSFKSGYRDAAVQAQRYDARGALSGQYEMVRRKVPWTYTLDWQTAWQFTPQAQLVLGALNVLDRAPPLIVSNGGIDRSQNFGYDNRYGDPRGRTVYANLNMQF
jgi:iron complex outermembrane recepter protein